MLFSCPSTSLANRNILKNAFLLMLEELNPRHIHFFFFFFWLCYSVLGIEPPGLYH